MENEQKLNGFNNGKDTTDGVGGHPGPFEQIISEKLCKCIKKLDTEFEEKSIAICSKSILNNKNLKRGKFKCKGKRSIKIMKNVGSTTRKNLK